MFPALFVVLLGACTTTHERSIQPPANPAMGKHHSGPSLVRVRMTTSLGNIELELDRERAPISVANFLFYAERGEYDGTIFHRVVENFVIQGGGYTRDFKELASAGTIQNEWQNGLKNVRGTIAMARDAEPNTATREFYINVADNPKLDGPRPTTGNAGTPSSGGSSTGWTWWTGSGSCRWRRGRTRRGRGTRRTTWRTCRWSRR